MCGLLLVWEIPEDAIPELGTMWDSSLCEHWLMIGRSV